MISLDTSQITIAGIAAIPATIAATAALMSSLKLRKPIGQINDAVNHRPEGEPKLLQIAIDTNERMSRVEEKIDRHLSWHETHPHLIPSEVTEEIKERISKAFPEMDVDS